MEGWSLLTEYPRLREAYPRLRQAQIRPVGRLLGTAVQCLAAIGHGDGICTTHITAPSLVPLRTTTVSIAAGTTTTESGGISA